MGEGRISGPFFTYATRGPAPVKGEARPQAGPKAEKNFGEGAPEFFSRPLTGSGERGTGKPHAKADARNEPPKARKRAPGEGGQGGPLRRPPPIGLCAMRK